jgi:hypothetical protein
MAREVFALAAFGAALGAGVVGRALLALRTDGTHTAGWESACPRRQGPLFTVSCMQTALLVWW